MQVFKLSRAAGNLTPVASTSFQHGAIPGFSWFFALRVGFPREWRETDTYTAQPLDF